MAALDDPRIARLLDGGVTSPGQQPEVQLVEEARPDRLFSLEERIGSFLGVVGLPSPDGAAALPPR